MTVPQTEDLVGTVFKGLTLASGVSWGQSGLTGEHAGQGAYHPEGLLGHMGLHRARCRSSLEGGHVLGWNWGLRAAWGCCQGECFPQARLIMRVS